MRSRDVVGKRITRIVQSRATNSGGRPVAHIDAIELEDGTRITFLVNETESGGEYLIEATAYTPAQRRRIAREMAPPPTQPEPRPRAGELNLRVGEPLEVMVNLGGSEVWLRGTLTKELMYGLQWEQDGGGMTVAVDSRMTCVRRPVA